MTIELVVKQLKQHRDVLEGQLGQIRNAITALDKKPPQPTERPGLSAAARARIAAAQRARWARIRKQKKAA